MNNSIAIAVKAQFLADQSEPEDDKFVYAYTIRLENTGDQAAQLISRYWKIVDSNESVQEVQGMGVIGEQPRLAPGETYTYTSGVVIKTPTGTMHGYYTMRTDDGATFDANIPTFALVRPQSLH